MRDIYSKLLELTSDNTVQLASSFKELLGKELVLGQTRHMCRYGTLSDGHEKITEAQRYYQALREMHNLAANMRSVRAQAMVAQADVLEWEQKLKDAYTAPDKLRFEGKLLLAKEQLLFLLTTVEDQTRMLDEYNKVRLELGPAVRAKYPEGIEQAEADNWKAVFEYRALKGDGHVQNIPLSPMDKAKLGVQYGNAEAMIPLVMTNRDKLPAITQDTVKTLIEHLDGKGK